MGAGGRGTRHEAVWFPKKRFRLTGFGNYVFQKWHSDFLCQHKNPKRFCVNTTFCVSADFQIWQSDSKPKAILCSQAGHGNCFGSTMAVLLVLPQPQAQQLLRAAEFLQQRGPDGHPRASPLARAQFSVAPVLLERALPCSCGGLASCRLQLRRSCPQAPEKMADLQLRQAHVHITGTAPRICPFFRRLLAGASQLQPAACGAAAAG